MGFIVKWLYDGTVSKENKIVIGEHERRLKQHDKDISDIRADMSAIKTNGEKTLGAVQTMNQRFNDLLENYGRK